MEPIKQQINHLLEVERKREFMKIDFNVPPYVGTELQYIERAIEAHKICGDGEFTKKCNAWFEEKTGTAKCLLTTSCTHATEMAALLCNIAPGDEVIMPSYTFVSTADAFVLRGAKAVFVDIKKDTMNIDENLIEGAITEKTKAIVVVHYAGVACEMDTIMDIAKRHNLMVVEDAAQGVMSTYKGKALGTIGDFGCYSFHETKNYSMGEGGALVINNAEINVRAERFVSGVDLKDSFASFNIGSADYDLTVKTAGTKKSRVEDICAVGCCHNDDSGVVSETVHLNKKLVKSLLTFIVTAAHTCTSVTAYGINFVDKYD